MSEDVRTSYRHFLTIPTRWMDNDVYGHVNNVVYYSYFDTVINKYLIDEGVLDYEAGSTIGLAIETHCAFHKSIQFPQVIDAGLRVGKLGNSSVRYEIGLFLAGDQEPAATGYFVHVFVDRHSRRPTPIAGRLREVLSGLLTPSQ
ncbi:MAG: acyl-CoA thioesterase [Alphaproteobacteria bacterium]|nr:thioesterase family protein [Alphaproteobacteria bacterium]TAD87518.1 MAG: acyl-CoA thioesterase [Alphaproteobacteria bacterium]